MLTLIGIGLILCALSMTYFWIDIYRAGRALISQPEQVTNQIEENHNKNSVSVHLSTQDSAGKKKSSGNVSMIGYLLLSLAVLPVIILWAEVGNIGNQIAAHLSLGWYIFTVLSIVVKPIRAIMSEFMKIILGQSTPRSHIGIEFSIDPMMGIYSLLYVWYLCGVWMRIVL